MMANEVKWIHIASDIFDDEKMYAIETQQDGYLLELVWFKILCLAGRCNENGFLSINNKAAYTNEMLAKVFRLEIGTVQRALDLFQSLEMIEVFDNAYMVSNWAKYQNTEGLEHIKEQNRIRQQNYRNRQKQLKIESNVTDNVTNNVKNNVNCSISNSNSISKDINKTNIKNKTNKSINKDIRYFEDDDLNNTFADFVEMRKATKEPMTDRAIKIAKNKINEYAKGNKQVAIAVIEQSILNNWKGIFPLKDNSVIPANPQQTKKFTKADEEALDRLIMGDKQNG